MTNLRDYESDIKTLRAFQAASDEQKAAYLTARAIESEIAQWSAEGIKSELTKVYEEQVKKLQGTRLVR